MILVTSGYGSVGNGVDGNGLVDVVLVSHGKHFSTLLVPFYLHFCTFQTILEGMMAEMLG